MINKVILLGNVGKDPEIRHLDNNVTVASFSLATSETYKNKSGEKVTNTEWHNIVVWRGLAEVVEKYVKKGSQIYVEGRIRSRSWDDKEGNKRYTTEIFCDNLQLLGRPGGTNQQGGASGTNYAPAHNSPHESVESIPDISPTDDLPF